MSDTAGLGIHGPAANKISYNIYILLYDIIMIGIYDIRLCWAFQIITRTWITQRWAWNGVPCAVQTHSPLDTHIGDTFNGFNSEFHGITDKLIT